MFKYVILLNNITSTSQKNLYSLAEQPSVALQPPIDAGVLGTLSEYAIQEGTSFSELSHPIKPKLRQGTSGSS